MATRKTALTDQQILLLKTVVEGSGSALSPWLDLDTIIAKMAALGWVVTKRTVTQAVDSLIKKNMIEKRGLAQVERDGRQRLILAGTQRGREQYEALISTGKLLLVLRNFREKSVV